jgi:hypothetical protein
LWNFYRAEATSTNRNAGSFSACSGINLTLPASVGVFGAPLSRPAKRLEERS